MAHDENNTASQHPPAKKRAWRNLDLFSTFSFVGAGVLGLVSLANQIRHEFYQAFILDHGENKTIFSPITSAGKERQTENSRQFREGEIAASQFTMQRKLIAQEVHRDVSKKLQEEFGIATDGFSGWVEGTVKRFNLLGRTTRLSAGIGFATTAAVSIGAISLLRHNKNTLDAVEDKLDTLQPPQSQSR